MLNLVVAIFTCCTVVICIVTSGTRQELHPTQHQLPNNLNKTVIYQTISCLNFYLMKSRLHLNETFISHIQAPERQLEFYSEEYEQYFTPLTAYIHIFVSFSFSLAKGGMSHAHSSLSVSAPHLYYTCPEGATVKLVCDKGGAPLHKTDVLRQSWLFTPHSDQHCTNQHPRRMNASHSHENHSLPPGMQIGGSDHDFWVILQNVTYADQGRYCCVVLDIEREHKRVIKQAPHSHVVLTITPRKDTIFINVNMQ